MFKNIIAASLLSLCAIGANARAVMSVEREVQPGIVESVTLFDEQRDCKEGQQYAEYYDSNHKTWPGCWVLNLPKRVVVIEYPDGDHGQIPVNAFRPVHDS